MVFEPLPEGNLLYTSCVFGEIHAEMRRPGSQQLRRRMPCRMICTPLVVQASEKGIGTGMCWRRRMGGGGFAGAGCCSLPSVPAGGPEARGWLCSTAADGIYGKDGIYGEAGAGCCRRAHQRHSVEMWPCRMDFSRRAGAEMRLIGRSASMRRFGAGHGRAKG